MIVTCENCQTRYLVPDHTIGKDGHHVRCKICNHEWFQELNDEGLESPGDAPGDLDEVIGLPEDVDDDTSGEQLIGDGFDEEDTGDESIPESVKPDFDDVQVPAMLNGSLERDMTARLLGYGAAAAVFVILIALTFLLSDKIVQKWPEVAPLYELVGVDVKIKGEDLLLDRLVAVVTSEEGGNNTLRMGGRVVNLYSGSSHVPHIEVSLRTKDGAASDRWVITPPEKAIEAQDDINFDTTYANVSPDSEEVRVRFIPGT